MVGIVFPADKNLLASIAMRLCFNGNPVKRCSYLKKGVGCEWEREVTRYLYQIFLQINVELVFKPATFKAKIFDHIRSGNAFLVGLTTKVV